MERAGKEEGVGHWDWYVKGENIVLIFYKKSLKKEEQVNEQPCSLQRKTYKNS